MHNNMMEFEKDIREMFEIINEEVDEVYRNISLNGIYFRKSNSNGMSGKYVFFNDKGYYLDTVGDRGGFYEQKYFKTFEELSFDLCWDFCSVISTKYASKNRVRGQDWRRIMFAKRVQLLAKVDEQFGRAGQEKINEILQGNPYDDVLLGDILK